MKRIEIKTNGELIINYQLAGAITWSGPVYEREVAGEYNCIEELKAGIGCEPCDEKVLLLSELEGQIEDDLKELLMQIQSKADGNNAVISIVRKALFLINNLNFTG